MKIIKFFDKESKQQVAEIPVQDVIRMTGKQATNFFRIQEEANREWKVSEKE